jgi:membrane-bound lytic murein transglycosylase D
MRLNAYVKPARFMSGNLPVLPDTEAVLSLVENGALEQELTRRYIKQYSSPGGLAWLRAVMKRAEPYIPFIREEIAARNLPAELLYLPVIESGYLSTAVSRSGAAGLWQFMKNSIGPFDMKVSDGLDERMDFWKSTQGALRKLDENYRALGDWALALAAYNAGLGALSRIVQRTGIRDYWLLSEKKELKSETIHYVPKFLAVSYILSRPRLFGLVFWPEDPQWTRIQPGRAADLDIVAREAGIDRELLWDANRELRRRLVPEDPSYLLKVPAAHAGEAAAVFERTDLKLIDYYYYVIKYGDTLSALAEHYGVPVDMINRVNPGLKSKYLQIGQEIKIPVFREVGPYGGRRALPREGGPSFTGNHLVKKGETLWSIALAYTVDPEVLSEANGMSLNDMLREGKSLKVPIME